MKFEIDNNMKMSQKRTIKLLTEALTELLQKLPFEQISIKDICEKSMIPRATFYNYFEDKYDLLNFYWIDRGLKIKPSKADEDNLEALDYFVKTFDNLMTYLEKSFQKSKSICNMNENGQFFLSLRKYMTQFILEYMKHKKIKTWDVPDALEAECLVGLSMTLGIWWVNNNDEISKEKLIKYFKASVTANSNNS